MHDSSNVITFPAQAATRAAAAATTRPAASAAIVRLPSPDRERRGRETMQRVDEAQLLAALAGGVSADISLNESLRRRRQEPWDRAAAKVRYLRASLEMSGAAHDARKHGLNPDAEVLDEDQRYELVEAWRQAVIEQLLTPAPRVADLDWKRRRVASLNEFDWVGATPKQVDKTLAEDETFLRSFPARHSPNRPKCAGRPAD